MKYFWTERKIKQRVHELEDMYKNTTSEDEKKFIQSQIEYVDEFLTHIKTKYKQPKMIDAYMDLKEYVNKERFSWEPLFDFYDITEQGFSFDMVSDLILSKDDIMAITYDFYKTLSPDIFNTFLKTFNQRYDHIKFKPIKPNNFFTGYVLLFPSLQEWYAYIAKTGDIVDVFSSIHENAHIVWSRLNPNYSFGVNEYISELIPITMELIASDYVKRIFPDQTIKNTCSLHVTEVNEVRRWEQFMSLLCVEKERGEIKRTRDLVNNGKVLDIEKNQLSDLLNIELFPEMYRRIAYIYAIELYSLYKKDPDYSCFVMKEIMKDQTSTPKESLEMLQKNGLIANEHSSEYHKNIILSLKPDKLYK